MSGVPGQPEEPELEHRLNSLLADASRLYEDRLGGYHRKSTYLQAARSEGAIDLAFGDPQSLASHNLVSVLQDALVPRDESWFAYKRSHPAAVQFIAEELTREIGTPFCADNVSLTNGQFGGLAAALNTLCSPGDRVLFFEPSWFYYAPMITAAHAKPVGIACHPDREPDLGLLSSAITNDTAAVIINSPNNPTGLVYGQPFMERLADVLNQASLRIGRPIYTISDEAYRKVVFDGRQVPSPAGAYPWTVVLCTFTKSLLMPGLRIGYLALPSAMPQVERLREELEVAQLMLGWGFPDNSLMYAVPELHEHTIDVRRVQARRDHLVAGLTQLGLDVRRPDGTLYCLARVPEDDWTHVFRLEEQGLFVLPGSVMGAPGTVRISLTADPPVIDEALSRWDKVLADLGRRA